MKNLERTISCLKSKVFWSLIYTIVVPGSLYASDKAGAESIASTEISENESINTQSDYFKLIEEKRYHFEIFFNVGAGAKKVQAVFFDPLGYGFSFYVPIYEFKKDFTLAPNAHYFSSTAIDTLRNRSFVYENYLVGATAAANKLYKIDAKASVFLGMQKESSIALESDARFKSFYYFSSAAQLRADYSISENVYVGSGLDFYYSRARWLGLTVALGVVL